MRYALYLCGQGTLRIQRADHDERRVIDGECTGGRNALTFLGGDGQCPQQYLTGAGQGFLPGCRRHGQVVEVADINSHCLPVVSGDVSGVRNKLGGHLLRLASTGIQLADQLPGTEMCVAFEHIH